MDADIRGPTRNRFHRKQTKICVCNHDLDKLLHSLPSVADSLEGDLREPLCSRDINVLPPMWQSSVVDFQLLSARFLSRTQA